MLSEGNQTKRSTENPEKRGVEWSSRSTCPASEEETGKQDWREELLWKQLLGGTQGHPHIGLSSRGRGRGGVGTPPGCRSLLDPH